MVLMGSLGVVASMDSVSEQKAIRKEDAPNWEKTGCFFVYPYLQGTRYSYAREHIPQLLNEITDLIAESMPSIGDASLSRPVHLLLSALVTN